jgi:hypothetical protein
LKTPICFAKNFWRNYFKNHNIGPRSKKEDTNFTIKKLLGKREVDKNAVVNRKLLKAARILERMVNQNTYNDIAQGLSMMGSRCGSAVKW